MDISLIAVFSDPRSMCIGPTVGYTGLVGTVATSAGNKLLGTEFVSRYGFQPKAGFSKPNGQE